MEKKLKISHFTDPLCFWCYAMEPEMRKIRMLLDDQLEYRIVMGVLSTDVRDIIGNGPDAQLRYEVFRGMMANHLVQSAKAVGMPISEDGLFSHGPEDLVSLPLSLAYNAMVMTDENYAEAYLRRIREVVFAEGRSLASVEAQVELAGEFPIDVDEFRNNLESEDVEMFLQQGIDECQLYGVGSFPSLLMEYGERRMMVQAYRSFEELKQAIAQLTGGEITLSDAEFSATALEAYMERYGKAAAREIQTMFSLNDAQLANVIMDLVSSGRYKTQSCGTSYFAMKK